MLFVQRLWWFYNLSLTKKIFIRGSRRNIVLYGHCFIDQVLQLVLFIDVSALRNPFITYTVVVLASVFGFFAEV